MIVPFLLLGNLFLGVYYNLSVWFKLTDKTYFGTMISIGGAIITVVFNLLLIPVLGFMGSAITTLICYFLMAFASYILGQKYYPIPYPTGSIISYILFSCSLVVISIYFKFSDLIVSFAFNLVLLLTYLGLVFLFEKKELNFNRKLYNVK